MDIKKVITLSEMPAILDKCLQDQRKAEKSAILCLQVKKELAAQAAAAAQAAQNPNPPAGEP